MEVIKNDFVKEIERANKKNSNSYEYIVEETVLKYKLLANFDYSKDYINKIFEAYGASRPNKNIFSEFLSLETLKLIIEKLVISEKDKFDVLYDSNKLFNQIDSIADYNYSLEEKLIENSQILYYINAYHKQDVEKYISHLNRKNKEKLYISVRGLNGYNIEDIFKAVDVINNFYTNETSLVGNDLKSKINENVNSEFELLIKLFQYIASNHVLTNDLIKECDIILNIKDQLSLIQQSNKVSSVILDCCMKVINEVLNEIIALIDTKEGYNFSLIASSDENIKEWCTNNVENIKLLETYLSFHDYKKIAVIKELNL